MSKYMYLASGAAALALLAATPALADTNIGFHEGAHAGLRLGSIVSVLAHGDDSSGSGNDNDRDDHGSVHATSTVAVSGTVTGVSGTMLTVSGKDGAVYTVNAGGATVTGVSGLANVKLNDTIKVKGTLQNGIVVATTIADRSGIKDEVKASLSGITAGLVTAVSGNTFTVAGHGKFGTTTVVTNGSTVIRPIGDASSTVGIGSRVLVVGTSSTSSPNTITADFVAIIGKGLLHLKHFFLGL